MREVFNKVLPQRALADILARNGAEVESRSATKVVYSFASGARAEATAVAVGQFNLRVLAPPGCACMK